jgi:glycosyltransferase involved in cell wall biosynthesis
MKNVLLLYSEVLFYKIRVFNKLSSELENKGYKLYVWSERFASTSESSHFERIETKMTAFNYLRVLRDCKIDFVIHSLWALANIPFYLFSVLTSLIMQKKLIYYGHGLNLQDRDKRWKITLRNVLYLFFDRVLLYSSDQIKYLWKVHHQKIYIANNTLDISGYENFVNRDRAELKRKYGIAQEKIVLFSGRIQKRKKLEVLTAIFVKHKEVFSDTALVIVGPDLPDHLGATIRGVENIRYLGPVYDQAAINEIFYMSDVFCIPGANGLGLVEAMYWGNPVLTLDVLHGPEICFLKDGYNGYITKDENHLFEALKAVLGDSELRSRLSEAARKTAVEEASVEKMIQGFYNVLNSFR